MSVEMFDYSHKRSDADPVEDDDDDLRSLIERQRKTDAVSKKDDIKNPKKSGSTYFDSSVGYNKDNSKTKMSDNYWDGKRKESKDSKNSSGKTERYNKHDLKSKGKKGKGDSMSSYELGFPFFSGSGSKDAKNPGKSTEDMDINETLKELAYLRSIQTGENALPQEEEEYFRKMNDLSKPILTTQLNQILTGTEVKGMSTNKVDGGTKMLGNDPSMIKSKWDSVSANMIGTKKVGNTAGDDETYGPSLPPKKSSTSLTSKKIQDKNSITPESKFNRERSSSKSKSDEKVFPMAVRGVRGGRGFRGRGMRGGFRGRGRGRGRGEFDVGIRGRGRGRSRGRFIRGGFIPSRGRHVFTKHGGSRRSRSRSSSRGRSRSSSYSRSRSRSRSRGRSNKRRRRSSSRSSYSSSSSSRSRSRDRGRGRKQTKRRSRSRSYSSRSRSRSRSRSTNRSRKRSRSSSRSRSHSRSHKRSRSRSRSRGSYKKQNKDRARSRSKSSSRSRSRKRKDRSRSWSFDEDYTKKRSTKTVSKTSETKNTDKVKTKKEQETKILPKPKKEKTEAEIIKDKNNKIREPKMVQSDQAKEKTPGKIPEHVTKKSYEKPKAENSSSPAAVALKDLKVTAFSNVFLPRTVSKTVGNISKGIAIGKGRMLPLKKHPVFDTQEEEVPEEEEKIDPKELERMREQKHKFNKEVDKVFNAKQELKDLGKERGGWKRVWPPEESPKKEERQEQEVKKELEENTYKETEEKKVVEDQRIVEAKDTIEEKKTDKEQKKEKKEKRRKEKEEKSKRKKEKKEKKEKKNKEPVNQERTGNEKEKILRDDGQVVLDDSKPEQYNQEGYSGYSERSQEYPELEYQYYEETGQEQGWYDENGVYHPHEEEEYLYYYDQEGNIVGYEGPEGYVEGNPFEEQQYYSYEGEQQEGVHPEVYGQDAYGNEYTGDAEGSYQYRATDYPVEGQVLEGEQYTDTGNHWEEYAADASEQQWYGAEGTYPDGEGYTDYQYAEGQEGTNQYPGVVDQQVHQDGNYMVPQGESSQAYAAPAPPAEELPKAGGDISESELVLALGKNLAALARLKGWNQQELLDKDPMNLLQAMQKPAVEKPAVAAQREPEEPRRQFQQDRHLEEAIRQLPQERKLEELPREHPQERKEETTRMLYSQERQPDTNTRRVVEQKPLKSILKKGNSSSLKPPPKAETSGLISLTKNDPGDATSDHVGPEYIVRISKSGPERFFCKLCQCHIESPMAKELHVKSMKHIELFVREKSSLLHSVIGAKQEDTAVPESSSVSGFASQEDKLPEKREASPLSTPDKRDYHESSDTSNDAAERNRLLDYDRLRLRDWCRREESSSSVENDTTKQFERTDEQDYESKTTSGVLRGSVEQERYEDRNDHSRWPRGERREADWRQDEQVYGRDRQHYAPDNRERDYDKGDYHRERRSLSHDSDRRDDRGSVGSRSSDRSFDGSEKDSRLETYRNRMQQDARPSARDRPGINPGESSTNQGRPRPQEVPHREQPSRQQQIPARDRSDKSRQTLNQNERERSRGDTSGQGRGRASFPPVDNREQAQRDSWRGQASRQDNTRQNPDPKVQETSAHSTSSSRILSSDRKEMARGREDDRSRKADQNVKTSERNSQSGPVVDKNQGQQSKEINSNRNTDTGVKDDRDLSSERHSGRVGNTPLPRVQNQKEIQEGKRTAQVPQQQAVGATNVKASPAALLGDSPRSHTQDQKPQEQVKSISTVIPGQRRVPPPPPPYNKGSGPQSFRGRGHPPSPGGRGGHHSRMPPNQPGMMRSGAAPSHPMLPQVMSHELPEERGGHYSHMSTNQPGMRSTAPAHSMPPQVTPHKAVAPTSGMPPREHFPGDQGMRDHSTPPYYGRGRAAGQPQFRGRGGSPHMSRGGTYGGPPQFASRGRGGRGGRGFHGQRW